jgi:DNA-binding HxlR family transcriptional regulator
MPAAGQGKGIPSGCPIDRLLHLLSGEWTTHILWVLSNNGPTRFGELKRLVEGISSKVLTERLRKLEEEGMIFREHEPTIPPKVTYGLAKRGRDLDEALRSLHRIAERWEREDLE